MSAAFAEGRIDLDGRSLRCFEAGQGAAVIVLQGEAGAAPGALEAALARKFRVLALEPLPQDATDWIARASRTLDVERYALVAGGDATAAALRHAFEAGPQLEALILLSPAHPGALEARLGAIAAPTLILTGTKEKPAEAAGGRLAAERIPESYAMLVYDAGAGMAKERPAALEEAIADFIERRGRFVLERRESALFP